MAIGRGAKPVIDSDAMIALLLRRSRAGRPHSIRKTRPDASDALGLAQMQLQPGQGLGQTLAVG